MTPETMHELSQLVKDGNATPEERAVLVAAAQVIDSLDDLDEPAAKVVQALRERAAALGEEYGMTAGADIPVSALWELYGLEPRPDALVAGAYGVDPHWACGDGLLTFCRNPLHPGPCKGWKGLLKSVAPGIHAQIEKDRLERVAQRRKDRKGQGKGRDGDGDGKKGEDDSKKPPKKPRRKAKDEPPPKPEPVAAPKISEGTREALARAAAIMPKGRDGWDDITSKVNPYANDLEQRVAEQRKVTEDARAAADAEEADIRAKNKRRRHVNRLSEYELGLSLMNTSKRTEERYQQGQLDYWEGLLHRALTNQPEDSPSAQSNRDYMMRPHADKLISDLPKDANGALVPNEELKEIFGRVQTVGYSMLMDLNDVLAADPEMKRLIAERDAASLRQNSPEQMDLNQYLRPGEKYSLVQPDLIDRRRDAMDANRKATGAATKATQVRRREILLEMLNEVRPMNGRNFTNVDAVLSDAEAQLNYGAEAKVAPADWRHQMDVASGHFPDDWVEASDAKSKLTVGASNRAFYSNHNAFLAMNTPGSYSSYRGGFSNYEQEVTVHELGHRMEMSVPGLTELEFAFVRGKTTHDGEVEQQISLKSLLGGSYAPYEMTYKDKFADAYTGKTYVGHTGTSAARSPYEAFQVGLQQLYGNDSRRFGDADLTAFTLGVLATLGRAA